MDKNLYKKGEISKINKNFLEMIFNNNEVGVVYISDISDYYINNLHSLFKIGESFNILIKYFKDNIYFCNFKYGRADFLNLPFEYEINETKNGFSNLSKHNKKEVLKWKK